MSQSSPRRKVSPGEVSHSDRSPDRDILYNTDWQITHNATRSGYRLKGPRLNWSRKDGGEGGSHPANVIDEPYSYGGLNWNGDDPVILPIVSQVLL
jgi:urea carboxylase